MLHKGDILKSRYLVLQKIGSGGHGTVFRARDRARNRAVAIKVLRSDLADDADYVRRFHREAKIASLLDSRHIVKILETDHIRLRDEHVHFQVMEYVNGPTLQQVLSQKGRFSTGEAVGIAIQIARALEEAHEKGVLHHDIKPKNIFIGEDETAKVGDFGIARAVEFPTSRDDAVLGTPAYMAPERCLGQQEQADVRSDIYSLGVVLYQMLAGQLPFEGDSPSSIYYRHIHDTPPPLTDLLPAVSEQVGELVERCLQKDPQHRFQTPRELRRALEGLIAPEQADQDTSLMPRQVTRVPRRPTVERERLRSRVPSPEAPAPQEQVRRLRPRSRVPMIASVAVILVLALGVAAFVLSRAGDGQPGTPTPTPVPTGTNVGVQPPAEPVVAYVANDGNLHVASETGEDLAEVTNGGGVIHPSWSPDGRQLAYVHMTGEEGSGVPTTELVVVNWDGSDARTVTTAGLYQSDGEEHRAVLRNARWSPDGAAIYYLEDRGQFDSQLNRITVGSDDIEEDLVDPAALFGTGAYLESFDVHPGDGTIVYQGCRIEGPHGCGLGLQSPPGVAARTAVLVPIQDGQSYTLPAWSLDGKEVGIYAYTGGAPRIMAIDAVGGDLRQLDYIDAKPEAVRNRFWPTLTPLPEGGFAYESGNEISIPGWGDTPSGITIVGQHPAVFAGSEYRRAVVAWPGVDQLDCASWWKGEYFANDGLEGDPTMVRCDERIDFSWGNDGPWVRMPTDRFSVRWTGRINITESGTYTFSTFTDDGVRLWLDDGKIIDEWHPQQEEHKVDVTAEEGEHTVRMQFYEELGQAMARLSWARVEPTPTPTPRPTMSPTPSPTARAGTPTPTPTPVPLPDLVITALRWEPRTLAAGDAITKWCVTVENRGGDFTTYVAPLVGLMVNGIEQLGPPYPSVPVLAAGKSRESCFSGQWTFGVGSPTAVAEIDVGNQVEEIDEENNTFTKGLVVGPPR
jgi:serine/threonine protein kinase